MSPMFTLFGIVVTGQILLFILAVQAFAMYRAFQMLVAYMDRTNDQVELQLLENYEGGDYEQLSSSYCCPACGDVAEDGVSAMEAGAKA